MKLVHLFHNPGAGNEEHSREELTSLLEANGYECNYISTKEKGWKRFNDKAGIVVIAGGDGTIRKVVKELLRIQPLPKPVFIGILPLGTANNIAKSLGISG